MPFNSSHIFLICRAENTGDDSIALFNVVSGGIVRGCNIRWQISHIFTTIVTHSDSFARGILLYNSPTTLLHVSYTPAPAPDPIPARALSVPPALIPAPAPAPAPDPSPAPTPAPDPAPDHILLLFLLLLQL